MNGKRQWSNLNHLFLTQVLLTDPSHCQHQFSFGRKKPQVQPRRPFQIKDTTPKIINIPCAECVTFLFLIAVCMVCVACSCVCVHSTCVRSYNLSPGLLSWLGVSWSPLSLTANSVGVTETSRDPPASASSHNVAALGLQKDQVLTTLSSSQTQPSPQPFLKLH